MSLCNTLEDLFKLSSMFGATTVLHAVPELSWCPTVKLSQDSELDRWDFMLLMPLLYKSYSLCTKDKDGKFRPVTHLFIPFDKERAPLNNNLLVYSNGQILWDNVKLAQMEKN